MIKHRITPIMVGNGRLWTRAGLDPANDRGQRLHIESEISELENLLMDYPEENVIDRASLEARLQTAKNLLTALNHGFTPLEELKGDA